MEKQDFWSDMALDNLENNRMESVASHKKLPYGIVESVVNLKNKTLADRVGKPQGVYVTYDASGADDHRYAEHLAKMMSSSLRQLVGGLKSGAVVLAVGLGNGDALFLSLENILPLQFRDCAEYRQHELSRRCSRVDGFFFGDKFHPLGGELLHQIQKVAGVTGEAADGLHHHHVPLPHEIHHALQLGTVGRLAAYAVDEDLLRTQLFHQRLLSGGMLVGGTDSNVPDPHCLSLLF